MMREFLRRRLLEEKRGHRREHLGGVARGHPHVGRRQLLRLDAFSCRDFHPKDALRLLLTYFDIEMLNCVNLFRFQLPRVSNFQVNENWEVLVDGRVIGELDSIDFGEICGRVEGAGPPSGNAAAPRRAPTAQGRRDRISQGDRSEGKYAMKTEAVENIGAQGV